MSTVSLDQLQDAVEWASCDFVDNAAYVCRRTGKIYWIAGDPGSIDEEDVPDDIDNHEKYLSVPNKRDVDLGNQLAFDFALQYLPKHYEDVRDMFRRQGAYGRFKGFLEAKDMLEKWYAYSEKQELKVLGEWCDSEGISFGP
jgi:hypothetical protein